jgi:hypothetical protein
MCLKHAADNLALHKWIYVATISNILDKESLIEEHWSLRERKHENGKLQKEQT